MKSEYPHQLLRRTSSLSFKLVKPGRHSSLLNITAENPDNDNQQQPPRRRLLDRRCGIDRRSRQHPVLMDTRIPHARRKQRQRRYQDDPDSEQSSIGIDVYS